MRNPKAFPCVSWRQTKRVQSQQEPLSAGGLLPHLPPSLGENPRCLHCLLFQIRSDPSELGSSYDLLALKR